MDPIKVAQSNVIYRGNGRDVSDLHCHREQPGLISAVFKLTDEERKLIAEGGHVELFIWTEPIPPVGLRVVPDYGPWKEANDDQPIRSQDGNGTDPPA